MKWEVFLNNDLGTNVDENGKLYVSSLETSPIIKVKASNGNLNGVGIVSIVPPPPILITPLLAGKSITLFGFPKCNVHIEISNINGVIEKTIIEGLGNKEIIFTPKIPLKSGDDVKVYQDHKPDGFDSEIIWETVVDGEHDASASFFYDNNYLNILVKGKPNSKMIVSNDKPLKDYDVYIRDNGVVNFSWSLTSDTKSTKIIFKHGDGSDHEIVLQKPKLTYEIVKKGGINLHGLPQGLICYKWDDYNWNGITRLNKDGVIYSTYGLERKKLGVRFLNSPSINDYYHEIFIDLT